MVKYDLESNSKHLRKKENEMSTTATKKPSVSFTEGPIFWKMLKFALPLMVTAVLQNLYNASDMIVVGNFSPNGSFSVGAVGACGSLITLFVNLFVGLSVGVGICVAQNIGAQRYDVARKYVHTAAVVSFVCGIALGIFGFLTADTLLLWMGTPETLIGEASEYMRVYFVGMPAMLLYNFLASALRSSGDSKRPLIFLTVSGIVNVLVNLLMVIGFGMGAVGVGIATTVSQYLSAVMIVVFMTKTSGVCKLDFKELKVLKPMVVGIIQNGLPTGMQSVVFAISNVLIQTAINSYGDVTVTGSSAANNIEGFIYVAMNAISIATITVVSQNVGAGKYERIKRILMISILMVTAIGLVMGGLMMLFHDQLLSIYEPGDDPVAVAVREAGFIKLTFVGLPYFLCGIMECLSGTLKGMGRSLVSMVISILGSCVLRIVWIYAVCPFFPGNIAVLYIAYPVTWIAAITGLAIAVVLIYNHIIKMRDQRLARETTNAEKVTV